MELTAKKALEKSIHLISIIYSQLPGVDQVHTTSEKHLHTSTVSKWNVDCFEEVKHVNMLFLFLEPLTLKLRGPETHSVLRTRSSVTRLIMGNVMNLHS